MLKGRKRRGPRGTASRSIPIDKTCGEERPIVSRMLSPDALGSLYDCHAQALFAFLLNFTRNETDTRDLLQDVFCRLAARPELVAEARDPRAFLLRLAHNLAIDQMRRRTTRERYHECAADELELFVPSVSADEAAFRAELVAALGDLPADQRAVVHLKLWENLSFAQIADALEIPLNTAASRYRYGIDKLRGRLRPLYEEIK